MAANFTEPQKHVATLALLVSELASNVSMVTFTYLLTHLLVSSLFICLHTLCHCWNRVNNFGRVGSGRVSVTDPVSDPVFVVFARALLLFLGREYVTLESVRLQ